MRWATSSPDKRRALALLDVSGDIAPQTRTASHQAMAEIAGLLEQARARGPMRDAPLEFVSAIMNSLAETTMDFMVNDPANADEHGRVGFDALCRMLGCIITGPTSGIGYRTARELARHGTERSGLGHVVRHQSSRPVRADRGPHPAAPRRRERGVRLLRRRRPRAPAGRGGRVPPACPGTRTSCCNSWRSTCCRRSPRSSSTGAPRKYWSTPARAAKVITSAALNESGGTGVYYAERGKPMLGSTQVRDPEFQDRAVAETRALLASRASQPSK